MTDKSLTQIVLDKMNGVQEAPPVPTMAQTDPQAKANLMQQLAHGVLVVEFTKISGEKSMMECTLDPRLLPPKDDKQNKRVDQPHLIHVYAVDRGGWRSFAVNNVIRTYRKPEML